jgi:hypothetical protein
MLKKFFLAIFIIEFNFEDDTLPRWRKSLKLVLIELTDQGKRIDRLAPREKKQAPRAPTTVLNFNPVFNFPLFLSSITLTKLF